MAEKLGKYPWEIDQTTPAVIWYIRLQWWWNTEVEVQQRIQAKQQRKARRGGR